MVKNNVVGLIDKLIEINAAKRDITYETLNIFHRIITPNLISPATKCQILRQTKIKLLSAHCT
jgi:hypothetical protein